MASNTPEYSAKYYEKNRQAINEKRKKKYREDAEYRKRQRDNAKKFAKGYVRPPRPKKLKWVWVNGGKLSKKQGAGTEVQIRVYRIQEVADLLDTTPFILRAMEKRGTIPFTVIPTKHRFYTKNQVDLLKWWFKEISLFSPDEKEGATGHMFNKLLTDWRRVDDSDIQGTR